MNNSRRFKRIYHEMDGYLSSAGIINQCKILNISMTGVLVSVKEQFAKIPQRGDCFNLTLYNHIERRSICIQTQVAHHGFSLVGLEFLNLDDSIIKYLFEVMGQKEFDIYKQGTQGTDQCLTNIANL